MDHVIAICFQFQIHPSVLLLANHSNGGCSRSVGCSIACCFSAPHPLFTECLCRGSCLMSFTCVVGACQRPPCQPRVLWDSAARRTVAQIKYGFITCRASCIVGSYGFEPLAVMFRTISAYAWVTAVPTTLFQGTTRWIFKCGEAPVWIFRRGFSLMLQTGFSLTSRCVCW